MTYTCLGKAQFDLVMNWAWHEAQTRPVSVKTETKDGAVVVTIEEATP